MEEQKFLLGRLEFCVLLFFIGFVLFVWHFFAGDMHFEEVFYFLFFSWAGLIGVLFTITRQMRNNHTQREKEDVQR
jgi:predicted tellurium resistance membrane protein TerC